MTQRDHQTPAGPAELDPRTARPIHQGHAFEDFEVGQVFEHHWGRTLNAGDNSLFTTVTMFFNPLYTNAEYARAHGHPDLLVNPMLVLSTAVGLSVEDLSEGGGPFLGVDELTFHHPVHPGDTQTARSTVAAKRESASRPRFGVVTWHTEAFNQQGLRVLDYKRSNLVAKRRSGDTE
ncbi:MAG TPA: MaoC family dehydratase [Thermoanaerobaculia bacterium]|nr:MaoC family dehydratase [Thermoanaerobaculia bacterium]